MSANSSSKLPGPFAADRLISPDAVTVPVSVGAVKVSPAIVVTVAPEAIEVEPIVGAEYEEEIPVSAEPSPANAVAVTVPPISAPFLTLKFLSDI